MIGCEEERPRYQETPSERRDRREAAAAEYRDAVNNAAVALAHGAQMIRGARSKRCTRGSTDRAALETKAINQLLEAAQRFEDARAAFAEAEIL